MSTAIFPFSKLYRHCVCLGTLSPQGHCKLRTSCIVVGDLNAHVYISTYITVIECSIQTLPLGMNDVDMRT
jgi:hypothetical protein